MKTATLSIDGMTCGGCVASVRRVLERAPGVASVQVDLATHSATVSLDPAVATEAALRSAVDGAGFTVRQYAIA